MVLLFLIIFIIAGRRRTTYVLTPPLLGGRFECERSANDSRLSFLFDTGCQNKPKCYHHHTIINTLVRTWAGPGIVWLFGVLLYYHFISLCILPGWTHWVHSQQLGTGRQSAAPEGTLPMYELSIIIITMLVLPILHAWYITVYVFCVYLHVLSPFFFLFQIVDVAIRRGKTPL